MVVCCLGGSVYPALGVALILSAPLFGPHFAYAGPLLPPPERRTWSNKRPPTSTPPSHRNRAPRPTMAQWPAQAPQTPSPSATLRGYHYHSTAAGTGIAPTFHLGTPHPGEDVEKVRSAGKRRWLVRRCISRGLKSANGTITPSWKSHQKGQKLQPPLECMFGCSQRSSASN